MEIKTFRAKTMQQALELVRRELGSEATVLHTRELNGGPVKRMLWGRAYEIAAAATPSSSQADGNSSEPRPAAEEGPATLTPLDDTGSAGEPAAAELSAEPASPSTGMPVSMDLSADYRDRYRIALSETPKEELAELRALVEQLRGGPVNVSQAELPSALFDLYTDLIEGDVDEQTARHLIEGLRADGAVDLTSPLSARARLVECIENQLSTTGPVITGDQEARIVALVGPTGVGKTTTIAKLAANHRLREGKRVGLITVDTYRIAAVEQLRTYADIIDLPMEVVSTPREMREAVAHMRSLDLILMDTAGRSPRDDVKIQELRAMLAEAQPDEVHLVLSAVGSARSITAVAERFAPVGITSLLVTKLDEAAALGNLLSLARNQNLPFSYVTDGQNVPDDIRVASRRELAELILGIHQHV